MHFLNDTSAVLESISKVERFAKLPSLIDKVSSGLFKESSDPSMIKIYWEGGYLNLKEARNKPLEYSENRQKEGYPKHKNGSLNGTLHEYLLFHAIPMEFPSCCGVAQLHGFSRAMGATADWRLWIPYLEFYFAFFQEWMLISKYTYGLLITTPEYRYVREALNLPSFKGSCVELSRDTSLRTSHELQLIRLDAAKFKSK